MTLRHLAIATLLSLSTVACLEPAPQTALLASTVEPGHLSGVWCSLDNQGAFTADSECLSVWATPRGYEYSWSDALEDETESGSLSRSIPIGRGQRGASGPKQADQGRNPGSLLFMPQYETFCYFGPQAGESGHFVAPDPCIRNYSATAQFIDGGVILHFATESHTFAQFE